MMSPTFKPRRLQCDSDLSTAAPSPNMVPGSPELQSPVCQSRSLCLPDGIKFADEFDLKPRVAQLPLVLGIEECPIDIQCGNGSAASFLAASPCNVTFDADGNDGAAAFLSSSRDHTPPATPRHTRTISPRTPPRMPYFPFGDEPPQAPKAMQKPILMKALVKNCERLVKEALLADPDAARFPFWDHNAEPPLCFAVRRRCKAEVVRVLLSYGADRDARDLRGNVPADLLQSMRKSGFDATYADIDKVDSLLGANSINESLTATKTPNSASDSYLFMLTDPLIGFDPLGSKLLYDRGRGLAGFALNSAL